MRWGLRPQEEVGQGWERGGNDANGRVMGAFRSTRGGNAGYQHIKAVRD